ncbi:coiled-coil domain-containing protein 39-like [Rhynchophorus ferrugineus]|uniref:coiled-coil domain-containing protein 39-like n=1 Tax=Rhynchophorus ferrugineus TaxID=354439 RepID=UPI003FCD0890
MSYLEEILKKLGWESGFQVPVANAENQKLEQELAELTLRKIKAKNALDGSSTKFENLKEHLKFVKQESEQTQKLITAYKQQYDSEEHQYQVCKADRNKIEKDIVEVNKRIAHLEERKVVQKANLQKVVVQVDKIKQETGWDIEALKAWEESLKKRDEDNELIKKCSKEDERRFNELDAKRQLLQKEFDNKSSQISKLACDLDSAEMIIERTGKAIKQQMHEREVLIRQWKEAVKMLKQRDDDIDAEHEKIVDAEAVLEKQKERLAEENSFLENEKRNNHELEMDLDRINALNSRLRSELNDLEQSVFKAVSEIHTYKRNVASAAQTLEKERMKGRTLIKEIDEKEKLCIKYQEELDQLEEKLKEMKGSSLSSEERIKKIQKLIDTEERHCRMYIADTEKINGNLYRTDQLLKDQQNIGKTLETNINNAYCICNKLRKHIRDENKSLEQLKEVVYDMEFRIDEFEQKLCKLEGSNKHEEQSDEKEERIKELEKTYSDHSEVYHTLQGQVDRLQDEMRKLSNFIANDRDQLQILQNKVENHLLIYDIGRKQIAAAKKSTQEKQVEENIMRLRIDHIEKAMAEEEQKIFNLQKLRLTLDQVMKERQLEIDTKKSIVQAQRRNLDDDRGRLKGDISLRKVKIEQLKKKYHIELMSLGKDDDGQPLSITHFKIKHAQEKFMLQQNGDELDNKIKATEKEIVAIENTLKMVNLTNVAFRNNLSILKENDSELKEMKALESLLKTNTVKLKQIKRNESDIQKIVDEQKRKLDEFESERFNQKEKINELEQENIFIEQQERTKEQQLHRTEAHIKKLMKSLRGRDLSIYDIDLEIRQLKHVNADVQRRLYNMTTDYPDIAPKIILYSKEQNVDLTSQLSLSSNSFSSNSSCRSSDSNDSMSLHMTRVRVNTVNINFN